MKTLQRVTLCGFVAVAVALSGCRTMMAPEMTVPLEWRPTDEIRGMPALGIAALNGKSVSVVLVGDDRPEPTNVIGRNVENAAQPRPVMTTTDVGGFLRANLEAALQANGVKVVPQGADRVLQLRVLSFFTEEGGMYSASVSFKATLVDGSGKTLWSGPMAGTSQRWGHSFSAQNYMEAFSNATLEALKSLLSSADFAHAAGA